MPVKDSMGRTIRDYLKENTADSHDRLDEGLGAIVDGETPQYAMFLQIQYRARRGIEEWLSRRATDKSLPPPQSDLIARDLQELGSPLPADYPPFVLSENCDPLGVCWVMAGSSLGNRALLVRLTRRQAQLPVAFLSDTAMTAYWRDLRPELERPHRSGEVDGLLLGAKATFDHFEKISAADMPVEKAA